MSTTNWPRTDSEIKLTGAYTCTHHNDQQRSECPVCLVGTLTTDREIWQGIAQTMTAERDQLRADNSTLRAAQKACEACDEPTAFEVQQLRAALTAERDHWQKIAVSASQEREHNANVAQAMTAERDQLCACLRDLVDEQNGAPLELRRTQWQAAMDEALAALTKTEDAK